MAKRKRNRSIKERKVRIITAKQKLLKMNEVILSMPKRRTNAVAKRGH
jgi:hypothetical protein